LCICLKQGASVVETSLLCMTSCVVFAVCSPTPPPSFQSLSGPRCVASGFYRCSATFFLDGWEFLWFCTPRSTISTFFPCFPRRGSPAFHARLRSVDSRPLFTFGDEFLACGHVFPPLFFLQDGIGHGDDVSVHRFFFPPENSFVFPERNFPSPQVTVPPFNWAHAVFFRRTARLHLGPGRVTSRTRALAPPSSLCSPPPNPIGGTGLILVLTFSPATDDLAHCFPPTPRGSSFNPLPVRPKSVTSPAFRTPSTDGSDVEVGGDLGHELQYSPRNLFEPSTFVTR